MKNKGVGITLSYVKAYNTDTVIKTDGTNRGIDT